MKSLLQINILQMKNQLQAITVEGAQEMFGTTSKMMYVTGMKTESDFDDVNLDFIRKYGIPSTC
jgi:hypothetical protein